MKKLFLLVVCSLLLFTGCGKREEEKLKQTECIRQSGNDTIIWTLYHDDETVYQKKYENKKKYDELESLNSAKKYLEESYQEIKEENAQKGYEITYKITDLDNTLTTTLEYKCGKYTNSPNEECNYIKAIDEFENGPIKFACITKDIK